MAEDVTITFTAIDEVSVTLQAIIDKMSEAPDDDDTDAGAVQITITSAQLEPEIEQIMWEMLDIFKNRAVEDEVEFLLNL